MSRRISQIMELLNASDEQASLEIKKGSKIGKSILETINSFSNEPGMGGGTIVLGIQETGRDLLPHYTIVCVEDVDKVQKDLTTQCADTFNLPNLRDLRKNELLVQKGASKSTYYITGKSLISFLPTMAEDLSTKAEDLSTKVKGLSPQTEGLSPQVKSLSPQAGGLSPQVEIPDKLLLRINRIGKRISNKDEMEKIIIELCKIRDFTTNELSSIIRRDEKYIKKNYLKKLLKEGRIRYTIPEMISHPKQKYTSKTKD